MTTGGQKRPTRPKPAKTPQPGPNFVPNAKKKSEDFSEELFQNLIRKVSNTNKVQRLYLL